MARLAAIVIAAPSETPRSVARASGPPRPDQALAGSREGPAQREPDQQDARHGGERQLPACVGPGARVEQQRGRGGQQQRVPARRGTRERERRDPRRRHHAGALQRRTGAGQRHVQRHEAQERHAARPRAEPGDGEGRQRERHEQHHVLTAHRQQMSEAGVAEVLARGAVDRLVLAEHHAADERGLGRGQPSGHGALGAAPQSVEQSRQAAAPPARRPRVLQQELAGEPLPAQMGREVKPRAGPAIAPIHVECAQPPAQPQLLAGLHARRGRPLRNPRQQARPLQPPPSNRHLDGGAEGRRPRSRERVREQPHLSTVLDEIRRAVEGREPKVPHPAREHDQQACERRQPAGAGDRERQRRTSPERERSERRRAREREPCGDRGHADMPRAACGTREQAGGLGDRAGRR